MATHTVTWTIDLDADSHQDAVQQAHDMCRDPESIATYYRSTLIARPSDSEMIDVLDFDDDEAGSNIPCKKCGDTENWLFENFLCTDCDPRTNPDHRKPFPKA